MNTTLTPLAASIERAQAALDRKAEMLGRHAIGTELNEDYWRDSVGYMEMAERDISMPTLFDFADAGAVEIGGAA